MPYICSPFSTKMTALSTKGLQVAKIKSGCGEIGRHTRLRSGAARCRGSSPPPAQIPVLRKGRMMIQIVQQFWASNSFIKVTLILRPIGAIGVNFYFMATVIRRKYRSVT